MRNQKIEWEIQDKAKSKNQKTQIEEIVNVFLKNRGIKTKKQR